MTKPYLRAAKIFYKFLAVKVQLDLKKENLISQCNSMLKKKDFWYLIKICPFVGKC